MCLYCDKKEIKIAENDIKCYKVVKLKKYHLHSNAYKKEYAYHCSIYEVNDGDVKYVTPFYSFPIIFNKEFQCELFGHFVDNGKSSKDFCAGGGVFHSFISKEDCIEYCKIIKKNHESKYKIIECIIPKGSKYLIGVDVYDNDCYGSEKIIYKEIL